MQRLAHHTVESLEAVDPSRVRAVRAHLHAYVPAAVLALALPSFAHGATRHVAATGNDGPDCGLALTTACRSITRAIELADPGDTVLVGPGRYGDLNRNGVLGEPGEELGYLTPPASCSCVLRIEKPVIVISSAGAAVTMIDGRSVDVIQNVLILTDGGEFGRPGKGFTVTETLHRDGATGNFLGEGIVVAVNSGKAMVRGNQVLFTLAFALAADGTSEGIGILTVTNAAIRIEGNQVMGWFRGIEGRGAAIVSKNQVWQNQIGIFASGGSVVGNVATANARGIQVTGSAQVTSNALYANAYGIYVDGPFSGAITKNNMFASNTFCGLAAIQATGVIATNNYWGVATGPGPGPGAEIVCGNSTPVVTPFATKPFTVKVLKP